MLRVAPPIQAPSASVIRELARLIEEKKLVSGPFLSFDETTRTFLVVVVEQGVIAHWQLESCHDRDEARALFDRYRAFVGDAVARLRPGSADETAGGAPTIPRKALQ